MVGLEPPRLDPVDDRAPARIEQWEGARPGHPFGPVGLGSIHHVGGEVGEQEEQRHAEQTLECAEAAAEAGLEWNVFSRPVHNWVWNSLSIAIPTIHANSEITSCTNPRTKPIAAPPMSSRNTKMSSAVMACR